MTARTNREVLPVLRMQQELSDGIVKVHSIYLMAIEILGSDDSASQWLNTEAIELEFRKPIDLMSSASGLEEVETLLHRMKSGVYA